MILDAQRVLPVLWAQVPHSAQLDPDDPGVRCPPLLQEFREPLYLLLDQAIPEIKSDTMKTI